MLGQHLTTTANGSGKSTQAAADDAEVLTTLLNAIIDTYADETREYDIVFEQGGYAGHLEAAVKPSKAVVRRVDRKGHREVRGKGEEAVENLAAFVQYRKALRR